MKTSYLVIGQSPAIKECLYIATVSFGPLELDNNLAELPDETTVLIHGRIVGKADVGNAGIPGFDGYFRWVYPDLTKILRPYRSKFFNNFYKISLDEALQTIGALSDVVEYYKGTGTSSLQLKVLESERTKTQQHDAESLQFDKLIELKCDALESAWRAVLISAVPIYGKWFLDQESQGFFARITSKGLVEAKSLEFKRDLRAKLDCLPDSLSIQCNSHPSPIAGTLGEKRRCCTNDIVLNFPDGSGTTSSLGFQCSTGNFFTSLYKPIEIAGKCTSCGREHLVAMRHRAYPIEFKYFRPKNNSCFDTWIESAIHNSMLDFKFGRLE